jgi:C_GCAxxG_C_C family probable redox protein
MKTKKAGRKSGMSARALTFFDSGFHCAESVLMSAKEGLGVRSSALPRIATGFGAGVGRKGSLCGALTGAIMGIGLAYGRQKPGQDREKAYALARKAFDRFRARFGSPYCMELIEVDLNTKAGMDKYHRLNLHAEKCGKYVAACAGMLEEELARRKRKAAPRVKVTRKAARRRRS